jgi:predicted 3-demethylubiquinone-9 3-methyltransferase (glyoxalase superfamily)
MMQDKDPAKAKRYAEAMMQMVKFDIAALQRACNG